MNLTLEQLVERTVEKVKETLDSSIEIEASGRHVHLSEEAIEVLFGKGYKLTPIKYLSQPNQFAAKERVSLIGPKGVLHQVAVLGPARTKNQVEVSLADTRKLGVKAPLRLSGDIEGSPGILLMAGENTLYLKEGLIVAKRHIHVKENDAEKLQVKDKEIVMVKVNGDRSLVFDDVVVRISPYYETFMHIDHDEANACGFTSKLRGRILKKE